MPSIGVTRQVGVKLKWPFRAAIAYTLPIKLKAATKNFFDRWSAGKSSS